MATIRQTRLPRFVRKARVRAMFDGISDRRLDELIAKGTLPAPIRLGERTTLFRLDELEAALERLQQRQAA